MSDKIGMNHTHIDFHKGTHGYPIKNADDMMKPCPLMPDGEWYRATLHIYFEDGELKYNISYSSDDCPIDVGVNFGESACYAIAQISNSYIDTFKLAECRMTFETTGTILNNMSMQTNYSWRVDSVNKKQRYYMFYYSPNTFSYYIADGDTYYDVYVYVVPCEHQNNNSN